MNFETFAYEIMRAEPYEWQARLGQDPECPDRLIRIPTGFGKTHGILLAWAWHRLILQDETWPRRLVWCLPMRGLVEQTETGIRKVLGKMGRLWDQASEHTGKVGVHVLMGGSAPGDWHLHPEACSVLIGTQDMLLSRTLNRGYGASRARWPMDMGLLNQDALWIMDEVQLMDVGLATSAQLQAFRNQDSLQGKELRPCRTWWMSATLQDNWLRTVDTGVLLDAMPKRSEIPALSRQGGLWTVRKTCKIVQNPDDKSGAATAKIIQEAHIAGTLTLVVLNTVDTARAVHSHLEAWSASRNIDLPLVHSRFRPAERAFWRKEFLDREASLPAGGRIIISTQVVEAGVDISARTLISDLAPWPSLVQRFGRCARYFGETGNVIVLDRLLGPKDSGKALPYDLEQLQEARKALSGLADVSPASLEAFEDGLSDEARSALYPYNPRYLILRREWEELFDTSPDLSGADLDISRFIRTGVEHDCLVFWRNIPAEGPSDDWSPGREELCAVPFLKAQQWLGQGKDSPWLKTLKTPGQKYVHPAAWAWDWVDGAWKRDTQRGDLTPGRVVLVDAAFGGYGPKGWDPESKPTLPVRAPLPSAQDSSDGAQEREDLSEADWKTIATHGEEVGAMAFNIASAIGLPDDLQGHLQLAGNCHDLGKALPYFQGSMRHPDRPLRRDLAKAPHPWPLGQKYLYLEDAGLNSERRPGLRHELGSMLALFSILMAFQPSHPGLLGGWEDYLPEKLTLEKHIPQGAWAQLILALPGRTAFDLVAYLVASHHGKVRMRLCASPRDQEYRAKDARGMPIQGVREGDELPAIEGPGGQTWFPPLQLTLEPAFLGLSALTGPSWTERTQGLLEAFGPGAMAFLEAILRAADIRASRSLNVDPLIACEGATHE